MCCSRFHRAFSATLNPSHLRFHHTNGGGGGSGGGGGDAAHAKI